MATTSTTETKVYDLFAPILNYKKTITGLKRPAVSTAWCPDSDLRRLKAYDILYAYYMTYSRDFRMAPESGATGNNDDIKEFGTPGWLCDKIKNKLLGGEVGINIPTPKRLKNIDSDLEKLLAIQNPDQAAVAELNTKKAEKLKLGERETYLQDWFTENMIYLKIDENETVASYLGACAYLIYWDVFNNCPAVETYDPGFIYPELNLINGTSLELTAEGQSKSVVSDRIFIAWQEEIESQENFRVYREVYELRVGADNTKRCFRKAAYYLYPAGSEIRLNDTEWEDLEIIEDISKGWVDLEIDFIPIPIIPNIQVQGETFGRSNIHTLLPLFDSIQNSHTDLAANSEHLGGASVFLSGNDAKPKKDTTTGQPVPIAMKPNSVYMLGESGSADLMDTSNMQTALLATLKRYDEDLIQLSDITKIIAGMIEANQIPSGVALTIMLQPLLDKIRPMRQQRQVHYSLMFYYVQRLYQLYGTPEEKALFADPLYDVYLQYGALVPSDDKAKLEYYKMLSEILDLQTVLEKMKEDGFTFDIATVMKRKGEERKAQAEANSALFGLQREVDTGVANANQDQEQ